MTDASQIKIRFFPNSCYTYLTRISGRGRVTGGNYRKSLYKQLMEAMAKVDSLESGQERNKKETKTLTSGVHRPAQRKRSPAGKSFLPETGKCGRLESENTLLRNGNGRMKRILNNDSSNSSTPPSKDEDIKPANTYNGRKPASRKPGAQKGHGGSGLQSFFSGNTMPNTRRMATDG